MNVRRMGSRRGAGVGGKFATRNSSCSIDDLTLISVNRSFVLSLISILLVWCILNATLPAAVKWDEYPFILLNLFLSMLAGWFH